MKSIRQRLLLWQIGALVVTAVLVSLLTYRLAWSAFNRVRDYGLQQIAYSVVRHGVRPSGDQVQAPLPPPEADVAPVEPPGPPDEAAEANGEASGAVDDLGQFVSQIWGANGRLLYSSLADGGPPLQPPGPGMVAWNGEVWRTYTVIDRQQTVQVAVTAADRAASFAELVPWLLAPLGLLVVLLSLLIHTAVERALAPLNEWGRDLRRRRETELHPVADASLPDELAPLVDELNGLLARVDGLMKGQRAFVAEVAHELNTPLAAVKLQAQLARRSSDTQRSAALDELDRGIERATHLVAQLLQIARLEPGVRAHRPQPLRLDRLAANAVAAFSARADDRRMDLGLAPSDECWVEADPDDLRVLLDNLVDNALRHTPEGGRIDVQVWREGRLAWLGVSDNGPGIAEADRARALQRFVRLEPARSSGSGLGLSIVAQIVSLHEGQLQMDEREGGGLRVRVGLAALDAPPA